MMITTVKELKERGYWKRYCTLKGIHPNTQMQDDKEIELTEREAGYCGVN